MRYLAPAAFWRSLSVHRGPLLALDVGTKHIGVSLSDDSKMLASGLTTLRRKYSENRSSNANGKHANADDSVMKLSKDIQALVDKHNCCGIVVGAPLYSNDNNNLQTMNKMIREIVELMLRLDCNNPAGYLLEGGEEVEGLPFTLWSEKGTTVAARRIGKRVSSNSNFIKKKKDEIAATLILQRFLSYHNQ